MHFEDFIARPALIEHLRSTFGSGRVHHAYIFVGPEGTGKKSMARICAQALFCQDEPGRRPCGKCAGCCQFQEGHPDVYTLDLPEKKTQIPVDSVRELLDALSDKPFSGGMRVVLCDQAELLNDSGQNALLKTLEEPPENTVFILCTTSLTALLPTVVSRAQTVRFSPLDDDTIKKELGKRGADVDKSEMIADYSKGSLGRALNFMRDEKLLELAQSVDKAYINAKDGKGIVAYTTCIRANKDTANEVLDCMEAKSHTLLCKGNEEGASLLESVMQARQMLQRNVSWQYILEWLYMRIANA